jgi:photosystem II stability/assembly factor-like uncharacterized protein
MRNERGRVSVGGAKKLRKVLLVPAALAVTVISAACGDDAPALAECADLPKDTGTCQVCFNTGGNHKECVGAPDCHWNEISNICDRMATA